MANGGNLQRGPIYPSKASTRSGMALVSAAGSGWAGEVRKWIDRKTDMAQITVADEEVL